MADAKSGRVTADLVIAASEEFERSIRQAVDKCSRAAPLADQRLAGRLDMLGLTSDDPPVVVVRRAEAVTQLARSEVSHLTQKLDEFSLGLAMTVGEAKRVARRANRILGSAQQLGMLSMPGKLAAARAVGRASRAQVHAQETILSLRPERLTPDLLAVRIKRAGEATTATLDASTYVLKVLASGTRSQAPPPRLVTALFATANILLVAVVVMIVAAASSWIDNAGTLMTSAGSLIAAAAAWVSAWSARRVNKASARSPRPSKSDESRERQASEERTGSATAGDEPAATKLSPEDIQAVTRLARAMRQAEERGPVDDSALLAAQDIQAIRRIARALRQADER